jgi:hypothetical protein
VRGKERILIGYTGDQKERQDGIWLLDVGEILYG